MDEMAAAKAIQHQLYELMADPPPGINAGPEDDDLFVWSGCVIGPVDTPYAGGLFFVSLKFGDTFPFDPPVLKFTTPVYHPNVSEAGDICMSILYKDCDWDNGWSPAITVSALLLSLVSLLAEPNPSHPLRPDVARQYQQDRPAFDAAARAFTAQHAK